MSQRQAWDFGRFFKTLVYFEILPFINCIPWIERMIIGNQATAQPPINESRGKVLIAGASAVSRQVLIDQLRQNHYSARVLAADRNLGLGGDGVDYCKGDLSDANSLDLLLFQDINAAIYWHEGGEMSGLEALLKLANTNLKSVEPERTLFDFRQASEAMKAAWGAVDDVVMGGVSESGLQVSAAGAIFTGIVSTANSGGFASVRNRNFEPPLDLSPFTGIQLRVKGDGKRYKFILRCEGKWDGISYCYSFDTVSNTWITIRIPFAALRPVFRAKSVSEADPLDASRIYSMQLMLSKFEYDGDLNPQFEPGPFRLQIESIKAYGDEQSLPVIVVNATETEVNETLLPPSSLPYTVLNVGAIAQTPITKPLRLCQPGNQGLVSRAAVAQCCVEALKHPQARDRVLYLCADHSSKATDWDALFGDR